MYLPSGAGEHLFLWIEKRDVSGERLLDHLSRSLGIGRGEIGMAGLKDRRAVTRQYVSVPRTAEARLAECDTDGIRVLQATAHGNKLRTGHLAGNRFGILIRDINPAAISTLDPLRQQLTAHGFPNAFGEQRFGLDGETPRLGFALLTGETTERSLPPQRRKFLLRLALSAVQSLLFNRVLEERRAAGLLHTVQPGDVMQVVASGGCFLADEVTTEQARFDGRETVLTGPLFGPKMKPAGGEPGAREQRILDESGLQPEHFRRFSRLTPGARRPLLIYPESLSIEPGPDGVQLNFQLPPGAYATTLLGVVMGTEPAE